MKPTRNLGLFLLAVAMPVFATIPVPTPEPSSMLLVGGGIAALILLARNKRNKQ